MNAAERLARHQAEFDAARHNAVAIDTAFNVAVFREAEGQYEAFSRDYPDLAEYADTAHEAMALIVDSVEVTRDLRQWGARTTAHIRRISEARTVTPTAS